MGANGIDILSEKDGGVPRRATMLAHHPEQSVFLHSGKGGFPVLHDICDVRDERRVHSPQPGTYGEMWEVPITPVVGAQEGHEVESVTELPVERALEIRNWSPGDSDGRSSILTWANQAAGGAAPRDLGDMSGITGKYGSSESHLELISGKQSETAGTAGPGWQKIDPRGTASVDLPLLDMGSRISPHQIPETTYRPPSSRQPIPSSISPNLRRRASRKRNHHPAPGHGHQTCVTRSSLRSRAFDR